MTGLSKNAFHLKQLKIKGFRFHSFQESAVNPRLVSDFRNLFPETMGAFTRPANKILQGKAVTPKATMADFHSPAEFKPEFVFTFAGNGRDGGLLQEY